MALASVEIKEKLMKKNTNRKAGSSPAMSIREIAALLAKSEVSVFENGRMPSKRKHVEVAEVAEVPAGETLEMEVA